MKNVSWGVFGWPSLLLAGVLWGLLIWLFGGLL
jgi:hypothetical protein